MIILSGAKDGRNKLLLGLSEGNIVKLKEGLPIHLHGEEYGFAGEIIIMYGATEDALAEELQPLIGPDTTIRDQRAKRKDS